jgi:hypothetical protein
MIEDTFLMESIEEPGAAAQLDPFAARLLDVSDRLVEPP